MKSVLVTGAHGFLGRHAALAFSGADYHVVAIDCVPWAHGTPADFGIDEYHAADVSLEAMKALSDIPQVIVHCAGSGSVSFSFENPYADFTKTVGTTAAVLEYLRLCAPDAKLVYPSSAAVYGCLYDGPIEETGPTRPMSPYGVHKLLAEQLCLSRRKEFGTDCRIIRFFSLYGCHLRKQLLWDACRRLFTAQPEETVEFFGTGNETRDWLHADDAARLMLVTAEADSAPVIINGASGRSCRVAELLGTIGHAFGRDVRLAFNNKVREGDPPHLLADIRLARELGWKPEVELFDGLLEYVEWFKSTKL